MLKGKNILLGITGGIAAYKISMLVRLFKKSGCDVKVILTPNSMQFVTPLTLSTLSGNPIYSKFSDDETGEWVNHVDLAKWSDVFIIAPATAGSMSKMATGLCDNLLLATYFSTKCPVFVAPAMDLDMYAHATTAENIRLLKTFGNRIIDATTGELASGLFGKGRMEEPENIFSVVKDHFDSSAKLKGKKVLITAGPTYERIDPVRFIGNSSSGRMGVELAEKALQLGAEVIMVAGPIHLHTSKEINRVDVISAEEMYQAVISAKDNADIIIMAAAVADYTPAEVYESKIKKKTEESSISLKPTKDILKAVGKEKREDQLLVGFALETDKEVENAKKKVADKNLDFIVLNSLKDAGAGFGHTTNKVTLIDKHNKEDEFELKSKKEVAADIFNKIISLLA